MNELKECKTLLYEIDKSDLRRHKTIHNVIAAGEYIVRDDDFIVRAFAFGRGTKKNMNEYMKNNACFCIWYDPTTKKTVTHI